MESRKKKLIEKMDVITSVLFVIVSRQNIFISCHLDKI